MNYYVKGRNNRRQGGRVEIWLNVYFRILMDFVEEKYGVCMSYFVI